jgi:hypothetical protein
MIRSSISIMGLGFVLVATPCLAGQNDVAPSVKTEAAKPAGNNKLMIVNGNSGRVIYDDHKNDLFCVTRRRIVGHDEDGDPIFRRTMRCR